MAQRDENFSIFVTNTLNAIGYKWQIIQQRREFRKQSEHITNNGLLSNSGVTMVWAGSKREGVTTLLGSDNDQMFVIDEIICTEHVALFESRSNLTILETDLDGSPPGYAYLTFVQHGGRYCMNTLGDEIARQLLQILIDSCVCVSDSGKQYVSSEMLINTWTQLTKSGIQISKELLFPDSILSNITSVQARAGPSIPTCSDYSFVQASNDNVYTITCHCPSIFERFVNRHRQHGWPPQHILEELSQLEAHAVPVGCKRSAKHFLEWRICFTKSEIRLIECLTEPQIHVFVLLKIFAKDVLKEVWDAMTSYIMKNVILWMAELIPADKFRTDAVVDRFLDSLLFLRMCVKVGKLPNYMISERNLLSHAQFIVKRPKLLSVLNDCLRQKGSCLFMSSRLKEAMVKLYRGPELMIKYGLERDQTEKTMMSLLTRLGPELSIATSPQDILRYVLSGNASDLIWLIFDRFTVDEVVRDPMGALQRMREMFCSHLR